MLLSETLLRFMHENAQKCQLKPFVIIILIVVVVVVVNNNNNNNKNFILTD